MSDVLDDLDASARLSFTVPGEIRQCVTQIVNGVIERDGDVDFGRVRTWLPTWCHGPESGAVITAMVRRGELVWTGAMAPLGNTKQRAGGRLVKVYRRTA